MLEVGQAYSVEGEYYSYARVVRILLEDTAYPYEVRLSSSNGGYDTICWYNSAGEPKPTIINFPRIIFTGKVSREVNKLDLPHSDKVALTTWLAKGDLSDYWSKYEE